MSDDAARIAAAALDEDGPTDVTTAVTVPQGLQAHGIIEHRSGGVLAGAAVADAVARTCECRVDWRAAEGRAVPAGTVVGTLHGALARILRAERPMLNLLQRASGIATATWAYVDAVEGTLSSPAARIHDQQDVAEAQRRCIGSLGEREFERFHTINRRAV